MADVDENLDELLSAFVDGELSTEEELALRPRLESEPALVAAIEALRADRSVRSALWKTYEPNEATVGRLIDRVDRAIDRQTVWSHRLSKIRTISAAAACIVLGVMIGRVTFGPHAGRPVDSLVTQGPINGGTTVSFPTVPQPAPTLVRIVDGNGRPLTLQPFNSVEEARRFIQDLQQWQQEQEQIRKGGGSIVPESTERF